MSAKFQRQIMIEKSPSRQELYELKSMAKLKRAAHRTERANVKRMLACCEDLDDQVLDVNVKFSF